MPDSFKLKPLAIGFVNYGFATKEESDLWPGYAGRPAGATGVLLNKARSGNGPAGTGLDSKKNFSWQDRAVFPGSLPLPNGKIMMYYDDLNTPYLLQFNASVSGKDFTLSVAVLNEFGLIGSENNIDVYNIQLPTITFTAAPGDDYSLRNEFYIEQSPNGRSLLVMVRANFQTETHLLGNAQRRNLAAIIRVDISGEVKKGLSNAGLSFNQTIHRTTAECSTQKTTENITSTGQLTVAQLAVVSGTPTAASGTRVIEQAIRYAYFDNNGNIHDYGFRGESTTYHLEVEGQSGNVEVASPCYEDVSSLQFNGVTVEERTTSSCNYYNESDALPADDWIDEGLYTWNEGTTSFNDPIYSTTGLHLYYKGIWQDAATGADQPWIFAAKDTNDDGEYDTCPQPSLNASAGKYSWANIEERFTCMTSFDPRATTQPSPTQLATTIHSGYGTANYVDVSSNNLAYDHVNAQIVEFRSTFNRGSFQQIPAGFVSSAVFY